MTTKIDRLRTLLARETEAIALLDMVLAEKDAEIAALQPAPEPAPAKKAKG